MPRTTPQSAQFPSHVFEAIGKALYAIQHVESALAHYIILRVTFSRLISPEQIYAQLAAEQRRTLGALITTAKDHQ